MQGHIEMASGMTMYQLNRLGSEGWKNKDAGLEADKQLEWLMSYTKSEILKVKLRVKVVHKV